MAGCTTRSIRRHPPRRSKRGRGGSRIGRTSPAPPPPPARPARRSPRIGGPRRPAITSRGCRNGDGDHDGVMKRSASPTIAFGVALLCATPAVAQFGNPFEPPRPPGSVPTRPQPQAQPQPQAPPQVQPQVQPANPQLVTPGPPPARSRIQSEDLPPLGGAQPAALP